MPHDQTRDVLRTAITVVTVEPDALPTGEKRAEMFAHVKGASITIRQFLPVIAMMLAMLASNAAYAGRPTFLSSILNEQEVVGVAGGSTAQGATILIWDLISNHPDQQWTVDYTTPIFQQFVDVKSNMCMGVASGSKTNGANVIQWPCNGHLDQSWAFVNSSGSPYAFGIVNENSGMCLEIAGANGTRGTKLVQQPCSGGVDQQWFPNSAPLPPAGWFACDSGSSGCPNTDPINVVFYYPGGNALSNLQNDLGAEGWGGTGCYNSAVHFDAGGGKKAPDAVMATDVGGIDGCGTGQRDHVRLWASPDGHTVYMAASIENLDVKCGVHCVVDFNGGRDRLFDDEVYHRLPGRTKFTANYMPRFYGPGTFTNNGGTVGYDGRVGFIEIGGP